MKRFLADALFSMVFRPGNLLLATAILFLDLAPASGTPVITNPYLEITLALLFLGGLLIAAARFPRRRWKLKS